MINENTGRKFLRWQDYFRLFNYSEHWRTTDLGAFHSLAVHWPWENKRPASHWIFLRNSDRLITPDNWLLSMNERATTRQASKTCFWYKKDMIGALDCTDCAHTHTHTHIAITTMNSIRYCPNTLLPPLLSHSLWFKNDKYYKWKYPTQRSPLSSTIYLSVFAINTEEGTIFNFQNR